MYTWAQVISITADLAEMKLTTPVCTKNGENVALSRLVDNHWRLIGWGTIQSGIAT